MTIPTTSKAFDRWLAKNRAAMPPELQAKADRAREALRMMALQPPKIMEQIRTNSRSVYELWTGDVIGFAEAYGAWNATKQPSG